MSHNFKVGDIIVSKRGKRPAKILRSYPDRVDAKYLHNNKYTEFYLTDIEHYQGDETTMTDQKQLYSFTKEDGTIGYGIHIGTNSANLYVIEEKGSETIHTLAKEKLEEVLPYTFSVKMGSTVTHFLGEEGKVKKNDVLLYTGNNSQILAVVTDVNTKNKSAKQKFTGRRVVTETL